ncbi:lipid-binding SYLF domain-containing protein [Telmatospirillum sp. J64-1]|uniref:lipid-binding SYLF domain-containing protein n=1 Tax=Telmatospirillum sp. J64-1 TaxID=2502183 RepID=UPI00115EBDA8|nr:lipid-binding SYLF domain-containing protein [Telmatospirillum sp. J64-1]
MARLSISRLFARLLACFSLVAFLLSTAPAHALTEAESVVSRAVGAIERLKTDESLGERLQDRLAEARAVLIVPSLLKAGFILGGEYGNGVLLVRNNGGWSYPAFYTVAGGSLGLQVGVQDSQVMFLIMSDRGLQAVMNNEFKVGAEIGVAFLTAGAGVGTSTTTALGADIIAFSQRAGFFGGGSLDGTVIRQRLGWNSHYYGQPLTAEQILFQGMASNPQADALRAALER